MNETTLSRLQPGMVILLGAEKYRVHLVNDCHARCLPVAKTLREYTPQTGPNAGKRVRFYSRGRPISISPNSEVEILEWPRRRRMARPA